MSTHELFVCRDNALLGYNSPFVEIPLYSGTTVVMSTHGLLCPSRAVCLHTDCCARVEQYVYTRIVVPE
jgi:hypothetical protein